VCVHVYIIYIYIYIYIERERERKAIMVQFALWAGPGRIAAGADASEQSKGQRPGRVRVHVVCTPCARVHVACVCTRRTYARAERFEKDVPVLSAFNPDIQVCIHLY
jgi:hypothetical protein